MRAPPKMILRVSDSSVEIARPDSLAEILGRRPGEDIRAGAFTYYAAGDKNPDNTEVTISMSREDFCAFVDALAVMRDRIRGAL